MRLDALRRLSEGFTDIARGVGKRLRHLPGGLVAPIADPPLALLKHLVRAPLQPLVTTRPLLLARERLLEARQLLVTILDGRFGGAPTDEDDRRPVRRGDQRIHAQIHANDRFLAPRLVGCLAHHSHTTRTMPYERRTSISRPGNPTGSGRRMRSVPL